MSVIFLFPGQGAQRVGMLHNLPNSDPVTQTIAQASAVLNQDCLLQDTQTALQSTVAVQLCLTIAGVAMARHLMAQHVVPQMVAGLSIGAFPAAVCAGVVSFEDALQLVLKRAQLMEQAYPKGFGMAAIMGLTVQQLTPVVAAIHSATLPLYIANLNAPTQCVLSCSEAALNMAMQQALQAGATKTQRIAIAVPSHCALLDNAAMALQHAANDITFHCPRITFLSTSAARALFDGDLIKNDLVTNMARQVRFAETTRLAFERGARLAIEMPSCNVLTNLTTQQWVEGLALATDNTRIDSVIEMALREQANG